MKKNHSDRTFDKQIELHTILKSYILVSDNPSFTYCDATAGNGIYYVDGNPCSGSPIIAYDVLARDLDIRQKYPDFDFNGVLMENGDEEFASLQVQLKEKCPRHPFDVIKVDHHVGIDSIKAPLSNGIVYFDPHGDIEPDLVLEYHKKFPNFLLLCNVQRNTILRWISRKGSSVKTLIESGAIQSSLISKPVKRMGWAWLACLKSPELADKLRRQVNVRFNGTLLYDTKSDGGAYYKLLTEKGHNVRKIT